MIENRLRSPPAIDTKERYKSDISAHLCGLVNVLLGVLLLGWGRATLNQVDLGLDTGLLVLVDDDAGVDEAWDPEQEGENERDDELGLADAGLHVHGEGRDEEGDHIEEGVVLGVCQSLCLCGRCVQ